MGFGQILDGFPYLLDLAHAQFGLIQEDEMLVQILVIEQDIALRLEGLIPSGTAGFLDIVFQRVGDIKVDHKAHVLFVHAHTECRGGNDDLYFVPQEGFLIGNFLAAFHLTVVGQSGKTVIPELSGNGFCAFGPGDIDDGGTVFLPDQIPEGDVLFIIVFLVDDAVTQIGSGCIGGVELQVQIQLLLEVFADVADDLLLCGGGEAGNRNAVFLVLLFLKIADEIADVQIIHPEILTPGREAVGLIDDEPHHIPGHEEPLDGGRAQRLGGDVEHGCQSALYPFHGFCPFDGAEQTVDGHRIGNAPLRQIIHLVLHQRLERGDHHSQTSFSFACDEGGKLKSDGFTAAGGENGKEGMALHSGPGGIFL